MDWLDRLLGTDKPPRHENSADWPVYEAAARRLLDGLFSGEAYTEADARKWQHRIDAAKETASREPDPKMRRAMMKYIDICQYQKDRSRRVWARIEVDRPRMERERREWEENERRAEALLAQREKS